MRINDIVTEQQLDEKPMGFLSKLGNKAAAALGSKKAQGKLDAGAEANRMSDAFYTYIGQTGQEATPEVVIDFLQKNGYPTASAEKIMGQQTLAQKAGEKVGAAATNVKNAVKGAIDTAKAGTQQTKQGPQTDTKPPISGKVTSVTKTNNNLGGTAKTAPNPANMQAKSTQNPAQKPAPAAEAATTPQAPNPSAQQPTTAKPSTGGVKIAGAKKKPAGNVKPAMQTAGTDFDDEFVLLEDGTLSKGQLNKIFMAATQDAIKRDIGGQNITGTGKADNAQTGGFLGGVKQGADKANANDAALKSLSTANDTNAAPSKFKVGDEITWTTAKGKPAKGYVTKADDPNDPKGNIGWTRSPKAAALAQATQMDTVDKEGNPKDIKVTGHSAEAEKNFAKSQPATKQNDQSGTAATPAPEPEQTDQGQAVGTAPEQPKELPAEIKQQLDALSDAQRKRLAGMLG